ncbi:putative phage-related endonuclease [Variovorax boronicumulans]|uniref:YqaJ viral recombinase family protein n=1 Tax=Variovorax boronicumulans TaxID=436515 RepID=UPI00277D225D|nr:YqaJ viral recombinase family protein [Variovorax boronicumulans]MDQ0082888.1 putative phage-related endonuclease [Variovorax boronicumulans]
MQTHDLIQGSDAWDQFRLTHFGASEAAAMLGLSKKTTRNDLLRMKKTGIAKEFSDWFQKNVLDHGHAVEAPARQIMQAVIGETLYPVTCSDGEISASCDGLTMAEDIAWENKQWNEAYAALVIAGQVPEEHLPQCQQVLMVTKAEKLYFSISDGTRERTVWVEVLPSPEWFARIRAGWQQFAIDLATYTPAEKVAAVVAAAPETLPAVSVRIQGSLAVASNLPDFGTALRAFIGRMVPKPSTDQEFADAEAECKALKKAEEALDASEDNALAELTDVDAMRRTVADLRNLARTTRLAREKIVAAEKENRRGEIVASGVSALREHISALNARLGKPYMPAVTADFAGAIKGKKNLDSMQDAVDTALANAKIEASGIADRIQINLGTLRELATGLPQLFPDTAQIVLKAPDDLTALVKTRVAEHQAAEAKKEEDQREKIRNDLSMSEIQGIQQQVMIATLGRAGVRVGGTIECIRDTLAETEAWPIDAERFGSLAGMAQQAKETAVAEIRALLDKAETRAAAAPAPAASPITTPAAVAPLSATPSSAPAAAPAPAVIAMPVRAATAPLAHPTLSLGQIKERIAPLLISAEGLSMLGFIGLKERGSVLFHESDFPHICAALVAHVQAIQAKQAA